jgi:hypothetical protein
VWVSIIGGDGVPTSGLHFTGGLVEHFFLTEGSLGEARNRRKNIFTFICFTCIKTECIFQSLCYLVLNQGGAPSCYMTSSSPVGELLKKVNLLILYPFQIHDHKYKQ